MVAFQPSRQHGRTFSGSHPRASFAVTRSPACRAVGALGVPQVAPSFDLCLVSLACGICQRKVHDKFCGHARSPREVLPFQSAALAMSCGASIVNAPPKLRTWIWALQDAVRAARGRLLWTCALQEPCLGVGELALAKARDPRDAERARSRSFPRHGVRRPRDGPAPGPGPWHSSRSPSPPATAAAALVGSPRRGWPFAFAGRWAGAWHRSQTSWELHGAESVLRNQTQICPSRLRLTCCPLAVTAKLRQVRLRKASRRAADASDEAMHLLV